MNHYAYLQVMLAQRVFPTYETFCSLFTEWDWRNLPGSPHGRADSLRAWLRSDGSHCAAAAAAAEAGFEAQESLLDLRESPGALSAAVQAGRGDGGGH